MLNAIERTSESGLAFVSVLLEDKKNIGLGIFDAHEIYNLYPSHISALRHDFVLLYV